jgi:hypothetical protein
MICCCRVDAAEDRRLNGVDRFALAAGYCDFDLDSMLLTLVHGVVHCVRTDIMHQV